MSAIHRGRLLGALFLLAEQAAWAGDFVSPPSALPPPLARHVQRFVDSTQTRDYQCCPVRTYRASPKPMKYSGLANRFYSTIGNSYFAYPADALLQGGAPLARVTGRQDGAAGELYLLPAASYDKFDPDSGWTPRLADGQQFLTDFDLDDRGIHYIAYSSFGWGLLRDRGPSFELVWHEAGATNPDERCPSSNDDCPLAVFILALRDGGDYYALVGNGGSWGLWDVNDPSSPKYRGAWFFPHRLQRNASGTMLAATNGSATVRLISSAQLVAGNREGQSVSLAGSIYAAAADGESFWFLPFDGGTTFYRVSPQGAATPFPVKGGSLNFLTAQAGEGFVVGVDQSQTKLRLYLVHSSEVEEASAVTSFMQSYYQDQVDAPSSVRHHGMLPLRHGGRTFLVWSAHGVGDVYEAAADAGPGDGGPGDGGLPPAQSPDGGGGEPGRVAAACGCGQGAGGGASALLLLAILAALSRRALRPAGARPRISR